MLAGRKRGTELTRDHLRPRRHEEERLRARVHLPFPLEQESPHLDAQGSPAGLPQTPVRAPCLGKRLGEQAKLGRLPRALPSLEHDQAADARHELSQRDDGARCALLDAVDDPVVHARHELVEVLLRGDEPLICRLALHLAEKRVEILLHLLRGTLAALDHLLRVEAQLLHLLEERHRCGVLSQRVVGALHSLILGTLADQSPEILGLRFDHSAPRRLATTNRSRPVRSSTTCTCSYAPSVATSSAATDARRTSTSNASRPPGSSAAPASRTRRAVIAIPSAALNSATAGSQSRTLGGSTSRSSHEMYGGFETTARSGRSCTAPSSEPARSSTGVRSTGAQRTAFARATSSASSETSVPMILSARPSFASARAIAPEPVPTSTRMPPGVSPSPSRTRSTSRSVSGRGISTRSSTSSVRCRNAACPAAYCIGAPFARRSAARRARVHSAALSSCACSSEVQCRGMSCNAASSSRASRWASAPRDRSSSADISLTSAPTVRARVAALAIAPSSGTKLLLYVGELQRLDDRLEVAIHHAREIVRRESDAMIGDATLRVVVGADLRRAVAGADLRLAQLGSLRLLLAHPEIEQSRAKDFHRLELVLQLRLLILLRDDQPRREVRDAHRGIGGVDALSSRTAGAEDVDPQVLVLDPDVDLFRFRQHGDGRRRGVNSSLGLRGRHALHAVYPALPAHGSKGTIAGHLEDGFLDAAERALGVRDRLPPPPRALDEPRIHAVEIGREQRGFVAARAGADLDDGVAVVQGIVREERGLESRLERRHRRLQLLDLASGLGGHLGVVNENELARVGELVLGLLKLRRQLGDRLEASVLPSQIRDLAAVAEGVRIGEQPLDLRRPGERVAQQVAEAQRLSSPWRCPTASGTSGGSARRGPRYRPDAACPCRTGGTPSTRRCGSRRSWSASRTCCRTRTLRSRWRTRDGYRSSLGSPAWRYVQFRKQLVNIPGTQAKRQADNSLL